MNTDAHHNGSTHLGSLTRQIQGPRVSRLDRLEKIIKISAFAALIFALIGIGLNQWAKPWGNIARQYQAYTAANIAANKAFWSNFWKADIWKGRPNPEFDAMRRRVLEDTLKQIEQTASHTSTGRYIPILDR